MSETFVQVTLNCDRTRTFETEDGGQLRINPGTIVLSCRLRRNPDPRPDEAIDTVSCLLRVADDTGAIWEAVSTFSLNVFVEQMGNLDRSSWLTFFEESEAEWKEAFANNCMVSEAETLLDDRFYRKFLVGDRRIDLKFKYQCPTFDVAYLIREQPNSSSSLLVRIAGLNDLEMEEIPPLVFEIRWMDLIFRNDLYFDQEEEWWNGDGWPIPLVFKKLDGETTPQGTVRFEATPR